MSEIDVRDLQCENCRKFSHCNNNDLVCIRKFQQLKVENEELKNKNESIHSIADGLQKRNHYLTQENERYIQCINEIAEQVKDAISEKCNRPCEECTGKLLCDKYYILQKIKEVEE